MILTEDYGNLNKIDSSFLHNGEGSPIVLQDKLISPNSDVVVDKVKPHSIDGFIKLLDDQNNQAIIFRLFNRQLFLVTNHKLYKGMDGSREYQVKISPYVLYLLPDLMQNPLTSYDTKTGLKDYIKYIFNQITSQHLIDVKPKWDAIIIKSDISGIQKQSERKKALQNTEIKPKERYYQDFIVDLKDEWRKRCNEFLKSHQANNMTGQEIKQYLLTRTLVSEFVFQGDKFIKSSKNSDLVWLNSTNTLTYSRDPVKKDGKFNQIEITISFKGFKLRIDSIRGTTETQYYVPNELWTSML